MKTLKAEEVDGQIYRNLAHAKSSIGSFIEQIYNLPGMGLLFVSAIGAGDTSVIMGIALVVSSAVVIANLLVGHEA